MLSLKELPTVCLPNPGIRSASSVGAKGPGKAGGELIWETATTAVLEGRKNAPRFPKRP